MPSEKRETQVKYTRTRTHVHAHTYTHTLAQLLYIQKEADGGANAYTPRRQRTSRATSIYKAKTERRGQKEARKEGRKGGRKEGRERMSPLFTLSVVLPFCLSVYRWTFFSCLGLSLSNAERRLAFMVCVPPPLPSFSNERRCAIAVLTSKSATMRL